MARGTGKSNSIEIIQLGALGVAFLFILTVSSGNHAAESIFGFLFYLLAVFVVGFGGFVAYRLQAKRKAMSRDLASPPTSSNIQERS